MTHAIVPTIIEKAQDVVDTEICVMKPPSEKQLSYALDCLSKPIRLEGGGAVRIKSVPYDLLEKNAAAASASIDLVKAFNTPNSQHVRLEAVHRFARIFGASLSSERNADQELSRLINELNRRKPLDKTPVQVICGYWEDVLRKFNWNDLLREERLAAVTAEQFCSGEISIDSTVSAMLPPSFEARIVFVIDSNEVHAPLLLINVLAESDKLSGQLLLRAEGAPMLNPRFVEGTGGGRGAVTIGERPQTDRLLKSLEPWPSSWAKFIVTFDSFIEALLLTNLETLLEYGSGDFKVHLSLLGPPQDNKALRATLRVYERLRHHVSPLLESIIHPRTTGEYNEELLLAIMDSPGALQRRKTVVLDPTQRRAASAVYSLLKTSTGVQAINGPPGTGKTTTLRAVVATAMALAALEDKPFPVIIGTGATNVAVRNVIEAFSSIADPDNAIPSISKRWVEGLRSYGAYALAVTHNTNDHSDYVVIRRFNNVTTLHNVGPNIAALADGSLSAATFSDITRQYVANANQCGFIGNDVATILCTLKALVQKLAGEVDPILAPGSVLARAWRFVRVLLRIRRTIRPMTIPGWSHSLDGIDARDQGNDEVALDALVRAPMFHLAARYWEGAALEMHRSQIGKPLAMEALRMLFPCIVATLHTLPSVTGWHTSTGSISLNTTDLLILDEAGQAAPEFSASAFALSRRAVVVGDLCQLEPISALSVREDAIYREKWPVLPSLDWALCVSTGSALSMAQRATHISDLRGNSRGLTLEHSYRCVPDIVAVSNDLIYGRLGHALIAERTPITKGADFPWSPVSLVETPEDEYPAERVGRSWKNEAQVSAVIEWLASNKELIEARYGSIYKATALMTPYRAQALALRAAAIEKFGYQAVEGDPALGTAKWVIGTVHSLQGMERYIILFSLPAHGASARFVDSSPNHLNVAVSRARDVFVLFASRSTLTGGKQDGPLAVLNRHV